MRIKGVSTKELKKKRQKRKTKRFLKTLGLLAIDLLIIAGAAVLFIRLPYFRIESVQVAGVSRHDTEAVRRTIETILRENYYFIIPQNSEVVFPRRVLENRLKEENLWIESVVSRINRNQVLEVALQEKKPAVSACAGESCHFVDTRGMAYERAPIFSIPVNVELYGWTTASTIIGERIIKPELLRLFLELRNKITVPGYNLTAFNKTPENNLEAITGSRAKIIFTEAQSSDEVIGRISTITKTASFSEKSKKPELRLSYIDVRLGNKIYYKFDPISF